MRAILLLMTFALTSQAQSPIIFGARGGVPFTDTLGSFTSRLGSFASMQRFQIGPTAGVRLPLGFSVEGDALYNRETLDLGQFSGFNAFSTRSTSWQFPVMLKFTGGGQFLAPVVGAGVSVRHINDFGSVPSYLFNSSTESNTVGFVAGGGLRIKMGPVNITPEVRYTRWGGSSFSQSLVNLLPLNRNEASVLIGITF